MNRQIAWDDVDVLIPKRIRNRHEDALGGLRLDVLALLAALPSDPASVQDHQSPSLPADAGQLEWKAWIADLIEALTTRIMNTPEAVDGVA